MRKIWHYLLNHLRQDFNGPHYLFVLILLAIAITFNYSLGFEDNYLESLHGVVKFLAYFGSYTFLYLLAVLSYSFFYRKEVFSQSKFWIYSLFGLAVMSLDSSAFFLQPLIAKFLPYQVQLWGFKVAINLMSFFTVLLPILVFYISYERNDVSGYGLTPKNFDVRPYFLILALMLPVIITVSFQESFLRQYPMYLISEAHNFLGIPEWLTVGIYEFAYGLDFITVEFLFRGFFVVGMTSILGRGTVLSMAVIYCSLHFGKPLAEAISSIAGGFILGVIAFETRSIWGGIIVHIGIAWMMEIVGFIQKTVNGIQ